MGKTGAILDVLPSVYGAGDEGKLLVYALRALAIPLEAADGDLYRIQQAHRLPVAPHARDILNLAGALDLDEVHFEDLLESELDYELRLALLRKRVRQIAALHLDGLGDADAVMSAAAILLAGELAPTPPVSRSSASSTRTATPTARPSNSRTRPAARARRSCCTRTRSGA